MGILRQLPRQVREELLVEGPEAREVVTLPRGIDRGSGGDGVIVVASALDHDDDGCS
jgi:hypothetical protein